MQHAENFIFVAARKIIPVFAFHFKLKDDVFCIEDGAVFAAELVCLAGAIGFVPYGGYTFDGAGLAEAYAAGHRLFHTDLAVNFFVAGKPGDTRQHRAWAAGIDNRLSGIESESVLRKPVQNAGADKTFKARGAVVCGDE